MSSDLPKVKIIIYRISCKLQPRVLKIRIIAPKPIQNYSKNYFGIVHKHRATIGPSFSEIGWKRASASFSWLPILQLLKYFVCSDLKNHCMISSRKNFKTSNFNFGCFQSTYNQKKWHIPPRFEVSEQLSLDFHHLLSLSLICIYYRSFFFMIHIWMLYGVFDNKRSIGAIMYGCVCSKQGYCWILSVCPFRKHRRFFIKLISRGCVLSAYDE